MILDSKFQSMLNREIINLIREVDSLVYISKINSDYPELLIGNIQLITGHEEDEAFRKEIKWKEIIHKDDYDFVMTNQRRLLNGEVKDIKIDYRIVKKDKSIQKVHSVSYRIKGDDSSDYLFGMIWDLNERSHIENYLEKILESTSDSVFILNMEDESNAVFEQVNKTFEDTLGLSNENVQGRGLKELFPKDLAEKALPNYLKCKREKKTMLYEEDIEFNKTRRYFETMLAPIIDLNGKIDRIIGFCKDISERKIMQIQDKMQVSRLQVLLNIIQHSSESIQDFLDYALDEAIKLTESKIGYIYFYDEAKKIFTMNSWSKEVMKECMIADKQRVYQLDKTGIWGEAVRQRKAILVNDFPAENPLIKGYPEDHSNLEKFMTIPVIFDDKIVAVVGVANKEADYNEMDVVQLTLFMDSVWKISERRRAIEELEKTKNDLLEIQKMSLISRWSYDLTTGEINFTDEILDFFKMDRNYPKFEFADLYNYVFEDDREKFRSGFQSLISELKPIDIEVKFLIKNKDYRTLYLKGRCDRNENGSCSKIIGSVQDITKIKEAEEKNILLQEQLHQSQKLEALGQLAGGVAHDFNNMLAGIIGNAEIIQMKYSDNTELNNLVDKIIESSQHAANLTKQLLSFSRKGKYQSVPINIHKIIGDVTSILRNTIDKRIIIEQHFISANPTILGDPAQIENALLNLSINARDAMPNGGKLIFETSDINNKNMKIVISDTGQGMSGEVKKHLFEPFYTTKEKGKGTGLGLAGVYGVIKNHSGFINVFSEEGEGTKISITLPQYEGEMDEDVFVELKNERLNFGKIMVIDDEPTIRTSTVEILRNFGYTVHDFSDGKSAIEFYKGNHRTVSAVILDMIMPELNGKETFYKLKKINKNIKVVISSGFSQDGDAAELLNYQNVTFLQKPYRASMLLDSLKKVLS